MGDVCWAFGGTSPGIIEKGTEKPLRYTAAVHIRSGSAPRAAVEAALDPHRPDGNTGELVG